jgi:hypothetical protein
MANVKPEPGARSASWTRLDRMRWTALAAFFIAMLSLPFISFGFGETSGPATPSNHPAANSTGPSSQPDSAHASAQSLADYGKYQLDWDLPDEAVKQCQAALSKDPANKAAASCLENAAALKVDDALNSAADQILIHKTDQAAATASNWVYSHAYPAQQLRARQILAQAQRHTVLKVWQGIPDWLRQALITVAIILVCAFLVCLIRLAWNGVLRLRGKITWRLLPLKELSGSTDGDKATDDFLDALSRLGDELGRELAAPTLLLLRPTPPASFMPSLITSFLPSPATPKLTLFPGVQPLREVWRLQAVRLDEAAKDLQIKAAAGIDVGSLIRFLIAIGQWISSDSPTISGSVERITAAQVNPPILVAAPAAPAPVAVAAAAPAVSTPPPIPPPVPALVSNPTPEADIHIAARGVGVKTVSITTSSEMHEGIDSIQLLAERTAFKFLLRIRYQEMTNDEVNGLAALRQGAILFLQFAGTNAGSGTSATARISSLRSAARNLGFFRTAIPVSC